MEIQLNGHWADGHLIEWTFGQHLMDIWLNGYCFFKIKNKFHNSNSNPKSKTFSKLFCLMTVRFFLYLCLLYSLFVFVSVQCLFYLILFYFGNTKRLL